MPQDPIIVEVEGVGSVEFPAGTSVGQINTALQSVRIQQKQSGRTWADTLTSIGVGISKGISEGPRTVARLVHAIPGVSAGVDAMYGTPGLSQRAMSAWGDALQAENTPESVGKMGEQIAETLIPSNAIRAAGTALVTKSAPMAKVIGKGAADLLPRVGVEAAAGGTMAAYQGGDPTAGAVLSGAIPVAGKMGRGVVNTVLGGVRHTPAEAAAVKFAQANNIPLDAATATGRPIVSIVQKRVSDSLGGAGVAEAAKGAQDTALSRVGGEIASKISPKTVTAEQAGRGIQKAVESVINRYATAADVAYDTLRQIEAAPSSLRTVRMKVPMTDAAGVTKAEMVTLQMPLPVDLKKVKAMLKPIYDQMNRQMPPTVRDASKGYASLKAIMESPDYMPASVIDTDLSQIKSIVREAVLPGLRNRSQGLAAAAVKELDAAVQKAVSEGGPDAIGALKAGRSATLAKYGVADVFKELRDEPVQVFQRATWANDAGIDQLRRLAKVAPAEMPKIGRAYVDGMLAKATGEGGFDHAKALWSQWQKLGPETKKVLFTQPHRQDLDNFFLLAKNIADNPNPSGTARVMTAFNLMNTIPSYALAKVLYSPSGVRQLTRGITTGNQSQVLTALGRAGAVQAAQIGQ